LWGEGEGEVKCRGGWEEEERRRGNREDVYSDEKKHTK
jgi:hypothetical protein